VSGNASSPDSGVDLVPETLFLYEIPDFFHNLGCGDWLRPEDFLHGHVLDFLEVNQEFA